MPGPLIPSPDQQAQDHLQAIDSRMQSISTNIGKLVTLLKIVLALILIQALAGFAVMGFSLVKQSRDWSREKQNDAKLEQFQTLRDQQQSDASDAGEEHSDESDEEHGDEGDGDEDP